MTLERIIIVWDTMIEILSFYCYNFNNDSGHGFVLIDQKGKTRESINWIFSMCVTEKAGN